MCQYEVVSISSNQCGWLASGISAHVWKRYTYHLCDAVAEGDDPCNDSEETEGGNDAVIGSLSRLTCRVCVKMSEADAKYALAEKEAYMEIRKLRLPPAAEPSDRHRKGKSKDKYGGEGSRGSDNHRSSGGKYHDDKRGDNGYDGRRGHQRMH